MYRGDLIELYAVEFSKSHASFILDEAFATCHVALGANKYNTTVGTCLLRHLPDPLINGFEALEVGD